MAIVSCRQFFILLLSSMEVMIVGDTGVPGMKNRPFLQPHGGLLWACGLILGLKMYTKYCLVRRRGGHMKQSVSYSGVFCCRDHCISEIFCCFHFFDCLFRKLSHWLGPTWQSTKMFSSNFLEEKLRGRGLWMQRPGRETCNDQQPRSGRIC